MDKFYITTAIPYVNAAPHLGHALEFVQTDVLARFHRLKGDDVFFLTGADENAQKNVLAAEEKGVSVQSLVDANTEVFKQSLKILHISNDDFIRTTDKIRHWPGALKLWSRCEQAGDIYKKSYTGLYCVGCEAFVLDKDLVDGLCPEHKKAPEVVSEENYFFRLSKYQQELARLIKQDTLRIIPESKKNEVLSFISGGLEDFSISRSATRMKGWGIPVPGDASQIIYVWFDALINYITALNYGVDDSEMLKKYWPSDVHLIGKGITRFHAVYWPAMLLSAGLELPKTIFVHGYITLDGGKMSKSSGKTIGPDALVQQYGVDQVRYYLLVHIPTFGDGDFSEQALIDHSNNELVATLGNLVNRTLVFINRYCEGVIVKDPVLSGEEKTFLEELKEKEHLITDLLDRFQLRDALLKVMELARDGNGFYQSHEPWKVIKEDPAKAQSVMFVLAHLCKDLAILLKPFLPVTSTALFKQLNCSPRLWENLGKWDLGGTTINQASHLFRKIESAPAKPEPVLCPFDLRVGKIISVEKHSQAEKLYIEQVDLGPLGTRQIVSGLVPFYTAEELVGRSVVIVSNLQPVKLRGQVSEGMLLAAEQGSLVGLVLSDEPPGTPVVCPSMKSEGPIDIKEFSKHSFQSREGGVFVNDEPLLANGKPLCTDRGVLGMVK